jgi:putative (di)nucleoside polyphosphate hydrolase
MAREDERLASVIEVGPSATSDSIVLTPRAPQALIALLAEPEIQLIMRADQVDEKELISSLIQIAAGLAVLHEAEPSFMTSFDSESELTMYRPNVGIILLNSENKVFVGQRADVAGEAWQLPQGGIDEGESPRAAALRELFEEVGIRNVEIIGETASWLSYDLPNGLEKGGKWKGQRQKWFAMRFLGSDDEINIRGDHPEFRDWRWAVPDELPLLAVSFKRQVYFAALTELSPLF